MTKKRTIYYTITFKMLALSNLLVFWSHGMELNLFAAGVCIGIVFKLVLEIIEHFRGVDK